MNCKLVNAILILLTLSAFTLVGQTDHIPAKPQRNNLQPDNQLKERIYLGGNVGGWIGTSTYLNLSPLIGYKLTEEMSVGVGFTYNYYRQTLGSRVFESTIYGSNTFVRYMVLENLFAQAGWDRLSVPDYTSGILNSRLWVDNILVGGGYRQAFSEKGQFVMMIFYNINQTPLSPYPNPIVQVGFNIGL